MLAGAPGHELPIITDAHDTNAHAHTKLRHGVQVLGFCADYGVLTSAAEFDVGTVSTLCLVLFG